MLDIADALLVSVFCVTSVFVVHNLFVMLVGVGSLRKNNRQLAQNSMARETLPHFSIVLPVKNEHTVVGRLLESLSHLCYPPEKLEIVIVEDGSHDGTYELCKQFAALHSNVKLLQRSISNGKPSALNYAIEHCGGEIIGFFDADAVPSSDTLLKAADYFADSSVAAIQGRILSINSNENMLTKLISYEEILWCEACLQGKETLGLFVTLKGSCQFIRSSVVRQLGGFDETFLSDDIEISARITEKGQRIRFCSDLKSWQENPSDLKTYLRQRIRWSMGYLQVAFKYRRLLTQITRKRVDAEIALLTPIIVAISTISYSAAFIAANLLNYPFSTILRGLLDFSGVAALLTLLLCGFGLVYLSKPTKAKSLFWFPFLYGYLNLQILLTLYAVVLVIFRRPKRWIKTEKSGAIANPEFHLP